MKPALQLFVMSCCLAFFPVVAPCLAITPSETMQDTVHSILAILDEGDRTDEKVWEKQRESVSRIVSDKFDMREMAKRSLAKHWNQRTPVEQDDFAELFAELVKNTYIDRLRNFSSAKDGTSFDKEIVRGGKGLVPSVVWQNSQQISVVYKLYSKDEIWLVYDVVIENVSLVGNYRSQFAQVIQKDGYEALVRKIKENLADPGKDGKGGE
ncbi:MAG: ABC transporter substrate-binding protein [Desulfobulbaceae bacterium]|jgi:phospholipid transport system substrate-binding protein|nr:ABC transporter substrate-binding protein [Desulfobulbaceae bacterium]